MSQYDDLGDESRQMLAETGQSGDPDKRDADVPADPDVPAGEGGQQGAGA